MSSLSIFFVALLGILCIPIWNMISNGNIAKPLKIVNAEKCQIYRPPPGDGGDTEWECEDFDQISSNLLLVACGNATTRHSWFPPKGYRNNLNLPLRDQLFLFDMKTKRFTPLHMPVDYVQLHGISLRMNPGGKTGSILAVNHLYQGSVIDLFHIDISDINHPSLSHERTLKHSLITAPNDVLFYKDTGFFVTIDHLYLDGVFRVFEEYLQLPLGQILLLSTILQDIIDSIGTFLYCTLDSDIKCTAFDKLKYPNGIAIYKDKLYVASATDASLFSYVITDRNSQISLRPSTITKLDFLPDNILVSKDDRLFVAGHPKLLSFVASRAPNSIIYGALRKYGLISKYAWSKVVELVSHDEEWFMGDRLKSIDLLIDDGSIVQASSSGMIVGSDLVVGMITGYGLAVCEL